MTTKQEAEGECPICLYLADHKKDAGAVSELLTFVGDRSSAFFLGGIIGDKVSPGQVAIHKSSHGQPFSAPYSAIPRLYASLDLSTEDGEGMAYVLDSLHGLVLSPGKTAPSVGLQAIKILAERRDKKQDDGSAFIAGLFEVVLGAVKNEQDRKAVAEALKHWKEGQTGNGE